MHGAFALLTALYHRAKTGEGQYIDMSQWECAMDLLAEGILEYTMNGREPERNGNRDRMHGAARQFQVPRLARENHGRRASIVGSRSYAPTTRNGAASPLRWVSQDSQMTRGSRRSRRASRTRTNSKRIVQKWTSTRTVEDVVAALHAANVAVGAVADNRYLSTDANLTARDFWVYKEHPEVGKMQHAGIPWRMSGTPTEVRSAAPTLGQHTDEVLTELLGYSASDVEALAQTRRA